MKDKILWIVVVLLVLWGVYALMNKKTAQAPTTPVSTVPAPALRYSITGGDAEPGKSIIVPSILLPQPGFIVVHRAQNYAPGKVIGYSTLLQAGEHTNSAIPLSESVKKGDQLYVMVHNDDNSNGKLDYLTNSKLDAPGVDTNSQVVMTLITVK